MKRPEDMTLPELLAGSVKWTRNCFTLSFWHDEIDYVYVVDIDELRTRPCDPHAHACAEAYIFGHKPPKKPEKPTARFYPHGFRVRDLGCIL